MGSGSPTDGLWKRFHTIRDLVEFLLEQRIDFRQAADDSALLVSVASAQKPAFVKVRWAEGVGVIHLIGATRIPVPAGRREAAALAIARVNATLPIPGFVLPSGVDEVLVRISHYVDEEIGLGRQTFLDLAALVVGTVVDHGGEVRQAISGDDNESAPWWVEEGGI